jgi:predicted dehydrogenase
MPVPKAGQAAQTLAAGFHFPDLLFPGEERSLHIMLIPGDTEKNYKKNVVFKPWAIAVIIQIIALALLSFNSLSAAQGTQDLKIGLIGLDTSHCIAYTKMLNDPANSSHVEGARITAAYPGGSTDIPSSINRLPGYRKELEETWGITIVETIPELLEKVDAVILTSVDGRTHLEQVKPVFDAGMRVFIDKPLAAELKEVKEIISLSKTSGTPFFTASSLRFFPGITKLRNEDEYGEIIAVDAFSPAALEPHHTDLYWYGIHGVETLYALMGPGCVKVNRIFNEDGEVVVGLWEDGRISTFRGIRKGTHPYGARVVTDKGVFTSDPIDGSLYKSLLIEVVKFLKGGESPVTIEEMEEVFEFMTAAQKSSDQGGIPVEM